MNRERYTAKIRDLITDGRGFTLKFYLMDNNAEQQIEAALFEVTDYYEQPDLAGVLYTCIKEMIINATKANLKRVLFEDSKLDINDEKSYLEGMLVFRNLLDEQHLREYRQKLHQRDYWTSLNVRHNQQGMRLMITNNAHITKIEEQRLRDKLRRAMQYDDIAQFYLDQGDEMEGAGMGIALIVMLIKGLGIDPGLFRIGTDAENRTFARIEIPLSREYETERSLDNLKEQFDRMKDIRDHL